MKCQSFSESRNRQRYRRGIHVSWCQRRQKSNLTSSEALLVLLRVQRYLILFPPKSGMEYGIRYTFCSVQRTHRVQQSWRRIPVFKSSEFFTERTQTCVPGTLTWLCNSQRRSWKLLFRQRAFRPFGFSDDSLVRTQSGSDHGSWYRGEKRTRIVDTSRLSHATCHMRPFTHAVCQMPGILPVLRVQQRTVDQMDRTYEYRHAVPYD